MADGGSEAGDDGTGPSGELEAGDRYNVQSVAIAAQILKALAAHGGVLPLRGLSAATGMPRAKVHRYLASLRGAGLVAQDKETGHYRLGPAAVTIGLVGLRLVSPIRQLHDALPGLRDTVNETVTAAIWGERGPIIIAMEESDHVVTMNVRVGSTLPLLTSVIGRLFAAYLPHAVTQRAIAREQTTTALSAAEVALMLDEIRRHCMSRGEGALLPGVAAIAAPVFDHRGTILAAICVVGRSESLDTRFDGDIARALSMTAARISQQLGFVEGS